MSDFLLHGFTFGTREERQECAEKHPLWRGFSQWMHKQGYSTPVDLGDSHTRELYEAFIHGAYLQFSESIELPEPPKKEAP